MFTRRSNNNLTALAATRDRIIIYRSREVPRFASAMGHQSALLQDMHKCPICSRKGISAARSPVWLCVECDCYWYWLKGKRVFADLLNLGAGL